VLGGAARFQVGDAILIGDEEHVIAAIDYEADEITTTENLTGEHAEDVAVKASDGLGTATLLLAEDVDFELDGTGAFGDQVTTAYDWARVLSA
jgi:hypothetical protein